MKKGIRWWAVLCLVAAGAAWAATEPFKPVKPYVDGEVVVRFKDGVDSPSAKEANKRMGASVVKVLPKMNLALVQLPQGADTVKAIERYRRMPGVVTAEPNYVLSPLKKPAPKAAPKKK